MVIPNRNWQVVFVLFFFIWYKLLHWWKKTGVCWMQEASCYLLHSQDANIENTYNPIWIWLLCYNQSILYSLNLIKKNELIATFFALKARNWIKHFCHHESTPIFCLFFLAVFLVEFKECCCQFRFTPTTLKQTLRMSGPASMSKLFHTRGKVA